MSSSDFLFCFLGGGTCPDCHRPALLFVSETDTHRYYECQWCGEEYEYRWCGEEYEYRLERLP